MDENIFQVGPYGAVWQVKHAGEVISGHYTQAEAIMAGRRAAKAETPSKLEIYNSEGTLDYELTF